MQNGTMNLRHLEINVWLLLVMIMLCGSWIGTSHAQTTVVWSEDWEGEWTSNWHVDNGTWEVGAPTSGPEKAFTGTKSAATVLAGNYAENVDTRIIRHTPFVVPSASLHPRLRFWHWYNFSNGDYGQFQIKVGNKAWKKVSDDFQWSWYCSGVWTSPSIDLTAFADSTVQIAFFFHSQDAVYGDDTAQGWYIDNIVLETGDQPYKVKETWDSGLGDWQISSGTWQIGKPTTGPMAAYASLNCAATVLGGNYWDGASSRLISPKFVVPAANMNPRLRFWHWYNFSNGDYGQILIKVEGKAWATISTDYTWNWYCSGIWSYPWIDLAQYANQSVQIAFELVSSDAVYGDDSAQGWYIDDVELITGQVSFNSFEKWDQGLGDWAVTTGTWQIGKPTAGPSSAYSTQNCAATVLGGNYWDGSVSKLISPEFTVPSQAKSPAIQFWHWYSFSNGDNGTVQLKTKTGQWINLAGPFSNTSSNAWTFYYIDLSAYADAKVRIAFSFSSSDAVYGDDSSTGWYIDNIEIKGYSSGVPTDALGPVVSTIIATPNPTLGSATLALSALISDVGRGDSKITQAEYFINTAGTAGTGNAMSAKDGSFSSSSEQVTATILASTIGVVGTSHKLYVRGKDEYNNWSNLDSATVVITAAVPDKNIAIHDTTAYRGTTITIPLRVDNWEHIAGAEIKLTFDAAILKAKSVTLPTALSGFTKRDTLTDGKAVIALARATALSAGGGIFLSIDFEVLATATPKGSTEIAFTSAKFYDASAYPLAVVTDNGSFTVSEETIAPTLASILVSPSSDTLGINGSMNLTATGKDTEGKDMYIAPSWSVTSLFGNIGSIASTPGASATFTAAGPGDGLITASQDGKTGSAVVVVGKTRGDINLDGGDVVNTQDAILGLQIIAKLLTPHLYQLWAADYDGSGTVLENDIQKILHDAVKAMLPKSIFSTKAVLVSLGNIEKREDGLISIPVLIRGRSDLGAGGLEISYDVNELTAVAVTPSHASMLLMSNLLEKGLIRVSSVDMDGLIDGRSVWINLIFKPKESLKEIQAPTFANIRLFDMSTEPVSVELGISEVVTAALPEHFQLHQNFPNPFNPSTTIRFDLAAPAHVDLSVYNMAGQKVQSLVSQSLEAGIHTVRWEGSDGSGNPMPAGLYFCCINIDHGVYTKINKMIFVK